VNGSVDLTPRKAEALVTEALEDTRVVTLNLAGLRHLAQRLRTRFIAGYVLYTGQQTLSYGGRIKALPIDALWLLTP